METLPARPYTPPVNIRVCEADLHLHNLHTRMPFKYGIATMTHMPMAFVRVALEVDGRTTLGVAADLLPPMKPENAGAAFGHPAKPIS